MSFDKEEILDVISRITPDDATTVEALMAASAYAVAEFEKFAPALRAMRTSTSVVGRHSEFARQSYRFLKLTRNAWLKEHGAYRHG